MFFEEFEQQKNCVINIMLVKKFLGLVEMTSGLVNPSFSLPEWYAVKMVFFAPLRGAIVLKSLLRPLSIFQLVHAALQFFVLVFLLFFIFTCLLLS